MLVLFLSVLVLSIFMFTNRVKLMSIAKSILEEAKNSGVQYLELFNTAASRGEVEQRWDEESTIFTFEDCSKLKFTDFDVEVC